MGKPTRAARLKANATATLAPALDEAAQFHTCDACGQRVDRRNLGDVLHHEEPGHQPIGADEQVCRLKFIKPLLPVLSDEPPDGDGWLHDIKHDGYRTQVHIEPAGVRAYTRNAHDWTDRYRYLADAAATLPCSSAILDGEVIVQDQEGRSDFHGLRAAIQNRPRDLVFMAFDLLHVDGRDLRRLPLEERRAELTALVGENDPGQPIYMSEGLTSDGAGLFAAADAMGLEGIVSKRLTSRYRSGPSKDWPKTKCFTEAELVVVGTERGDRAPVALLARETEDGLKYAGGAMVTLPARERDRFWDAMERLQAIKPALPMRKRGSARWVRPELRVRVRTLRGEEMLRHATIKSIGSRRVG